MAVVNSVVIGRGRKSVGEVTLRHDRGRTIAARRITINNSKTARQVEQRQFFKVAQGFVTYNSPIINLCYSKSKYGSARNNFFRRNYPILKGFWWYRQSLDPFNPLYWGPTGYPFIVGNPENDGEFALDMRPYVTYSEGGKAAIDSSIPIVWGEVQPIMGNRLLNAMSVIRWKIPATIEEYNSGTVTVIAWQDLNLTDSTYYVATYNLGDKDEYFAYDNVNACINFDFPYDEFLNGNLKPSGMKNDEDAAMAPWAAVFVVNIGGKIVKTTSLLINAEWNPNAMALVYEKMIANNEIRIQQAEPWINYWKINGGSAIETPSQMVISAEGDKNTETGYADVSDEGNIPRASKKKK